jgi:urease accessory protein
MWSNTLIIDRFVPFVDTGDLQEKAEDRLVLAWEERRWLRGRFTTERGRKVGIALPTGTAVPPGSILHVGDDWYLKLEAAIEPVLEMFPADSAEAVKIAFEVGNRHFPLALAGEKIMVPDDRTMVRLLERLGIPFHRKQAAFDPIGNTQLHQHAAIS